MIREAATFIRRTGSRGDVNLSAERILAALDQLEVQQPSKECHNADHPSILCCPHFFDTTPQHIGGLTVDEVMGIYHEWDKQAADGIIPMIPDLRARLTAKLQGK